MIIDTKDLEVAAVGISVAAGCRPCTNHHLKAASEAGASVAEIAEGINVGIAVANAAVQDFHQRFESERAAADDRPIGNELSRRGLLAAIGSSVARNSVAQLKTTVELARQRGMSDQEIAEIIGLANRIKEKAAAHLVSLIETLDADTDIAKDVASLCT